MPLRGHRRHRLAGNQAAHDRPGRQVLQPSGHGATVLSGRDSGRSLASAWEAAQAKSEGAAECGNSMKRPVVAVTGRLKGGPRYLQVEPRECDDSGQHFLVSDNGKLVEVNSQPTRPGVSPYGYS